MLFSEMYKIMVNKVSPVS